MRAGEEDSSRDERTTQHEDHSSRDEEQAKIKTSACHDGEREYQRLAARSPLNCSEAGDRVGMR